MVGPVAILPALQGTGYGRMLKAAQAGAMRPAAPLPRVLIGDAPYYGRFGFSEAPRGWRCPGPWQPERLLVRGADPAALPQEGMLGPWRKG
jgi:predicted N-acetyltransferase YhbS